DVETSHAGMYAGVYLHGERLTDGQVEALHAATVEVTTGGVGSPPITPSGGYWPLLDDADDASGNGNHGTAVDDPDFVDPDTPGGSVSHAWVGACTDSGFTVSCKIDGPADARLAVDTDDGFSDPIFSTVAVDADGWTKLTVSGLAADTTYHWAIELDSELEETPRGAIRTFPPEGEPASFVFAAGSCNVTGSTAVTHGRIRDRSPLLMLQMGDLHYEDPDENDPAVYREAWEAALASETQAALYQNVPVAYMWDDHDWAPNDGDGSHVGRPAALTAYREVVPHYPISFAGDPDDTPVGQTFVAGRVRFVVLDTR